MTSEKNGRKNRKEGKERHVVSMGTGARTRSGKHGKNGRRG